ncbi:MAG: metallophosphoesterase family protein [Chitinophagaceae bacterium]|nr:metallophosphoesterase family protein [Chitinophagaceae bacterium]
MKRIGLISDTHGWLDEKVFEYFKDCDEVWHAGDLGSMELVDQLRSKWSDLPAGQADRDGETRLKGVYGNIDGNEIRSIYPEQLVFMCEEVKVMMRHIGGSPPRYNPETKKQLAIHKPQLFISGHSHILKVIYDDKINCLHMNPGAAGKQGWHKVRTIIRFVIDRKDMKDCEVIELGKR